MGQSFCLLRTLIPGGVSFLVVTERRSPVMSIISITTRSARISLIGH